ncbi:hypothetical protein EJ03DRAFT_36600 [Teratosphaeria nubilosa]|uniref:Uncharacterized protein n=1 Tax=Teratosphaeria nubilosa TaxID=161662 RepID=A0A6G1LEC0_9PEZI|nr:hypothetical protein EJ03DRAFT_36600 [Teratosphaeria nubilosa]
MTKIFASYSGLRELNLHAGTQQPARYTDNEMVGMRKNGSDNHNGSLEIVTQVLMASALYMKTTIQHVEVLGLWCCPHTFASLLKQMTKKLRSLKLLLLHLIPFHTRPILETLNRSAPMLEEATVLSLGGATAGQYITFTDMRQIVVKAFPQAMQRVHGQFTSGRRTIGWLCMRGSLVTMDCREAVEAGLKKMLESLPESK